MEGSSQAFASGDQSDSEQDGPAEDSALDEFPVCVNEEATEDFNKYYQQQLSAIPSAEDTSAVDNVPPQRGASLLQRPIPAQPKRSARWQGRSHSDPALSEGSPVSGSLLPRPEVALEAAAQAAIHNGVWQTDGSRHALAASAERHVSAVMFWPLCGPDVTRCV